MVDGKLEESGSSPDWGRSKREAPTIDLEATDVSVKTEDVGADAQPEPASRADSSQEFSDQNSSVAISPWVIAPVSGAVAAALVIAVGWLLGWPAVPPATAPAPQINAAAIDGLAARIASVESKAGKPTPDPATITRLEAVEKSLGGLRAELASLRAQSEKLAADLKNSSAPRESSGATDMSAVNERIAEIERALRVQSAEIARQSERVTDTKPPDDMPLRRVVVAALLDLSVRHGDPFAATLATAKSLAPNPEALKPLDGFAASGVPNPSALNRELLTLVPKLTPRVPENSTTGTSIVDRLQAGAARLVRIERTDAAGNDHGAIVARVTAAAVRNDFAEARRDLDMLAPADRATVQPWLDKVAAREAALAASRQFAADAMTALAKPAQ